MNFRDIRVRKNLTQSDVAKALGVSSVVYSRYENGVRQPPVDILVQMAEYFDVTVDYLLGRREIDGHDLSEYELKLLTASREADDRARQDALNILLAHPMSTAQ